MQARRILGREVNLAIAAHRGHVAVEGADRGLVRVRFEGGSRGAAWPK
jgi:hypothetical protein